MTTDQKLDRVIAELDEFRREFRSFVTTLFGRPGSVMASGSFTPPADLSRAIAALPDEAREYMEAQLGGNQPTSRDIARAADWYERKAA